MKRILSAGMSAVWLAAAVSCAAPGGGDPADEVSRKAVLGWGGDPGMGRLIVEFCGRSEPRVALVCAPSGDSRSAFDDARGMFAASSSRIGEIRLLGVGVTAGQLREQLKDVDIIWVCGGMTENLNNSGWTSILLPVLREAYDRGVVISGYSAGAICWTFAGYNDFSDGRYDLIPGCGFLPFYFCPHYQAWGAFDDRLDREPGGAEYPDTAWALTDGAALLVVNGVPAPAFCDPAARAFRFDRSGVGWNRVEFAPETP